MKNKSFEIMLKELEEVVTKLEQKDINLEDAVEEYKNGIKLAKECYEILESAEKVIVKENKE
jgi:exodeoxyribonuclease VII small subunit